MSKIDELKSFVVSELEDPPVFFTVFHNMGYENAMNKILKKIEELEG